MYDYKKRYAYLKEKVLKDKKINEGNRKLFGKFFEYEEKKLKRINDLRELDDACYKTLEGYCIRLKIVNRWFKNKEWKKLTKADIQKMYDDVEDGKIKNKRGVPFKDLKSYYSKIIKSKPFEMAGKKKLAEDVIQYSKKNNEEVRFIELKEFEDLVKVANRIDQKLLLWLAFDIGENIMSLLELRKNNIVKRVNEDSKEPEYIINIPKEKMKRSRTIGGEITNFRETVSYLDLVLKDLGDEDKLFNFEYRQAVKFLDRCIRITGVKCKPKGEKPSWKDLRSSMACYLLKEGWDAFEINRRLHHTPNSPTINKYINYLATDKRKPKRKIYESNLMKIEGELEEVKKREKIKDMKIEDLKETMRIVKEQILEQAKLINEDVLKKEKNILKNEKIILELKKRMK